ncbi:MAG: class I SAM-dependent rRNA methyltransferase [Myxococcales bacterium]|nr:class I SAM-dependent rRNA methyltransferase [Myxococcales bacterium]
MARNPRSRHERTEVHLCKKLRRRIQRGHPWVFDKGVDPGAKLTPGQLVKVTDEKGSFALAFADPDSPIRLRVLDTRTRAEIDGEWIAARGRRAVGRRLQDPRLKRTDALRLIHGEADGLPGLVIDSYAGHGIVLLDGGGSHALWLPLLPSLRASLEDAGMPLETLSVRRVGRDREWIGSPPPERVQIREGDATMEVDLRRGQKTGLFLDQRENRALVGSRSKGLRVLNLFGYTGGFSLAAALGGAAKTTTVDIASPAIEAAKRNFVLSGLDPAKHAFAAADVFDFLEEAIATKKTYDLVICDPPSFASSEKALVKGLRAYRRVNEMAMRVVAPRGIFCSASCSSHVTAKHLLEVVADAAMEVRRDLVVTDQRGAASDHPVRPGFPEGRYLSFFLCAME